MPDAPARPARDRPTDPGAEVVDAVRVAYDRYNAGLEGTRYDRFVRFMNFGFDDPEPAARRPGNPAVRLVEEVLGDEPLDGRVVVDVGCGRGGTLGLVRRRAPSATAVGVDLVVSSLRAARRGRLSSPVVAGDAQRLPLRTSSVDVVVNIESAVHYPDPAAFYAEVGRCLRPGGAFLYADLWVAAAVDDYRRLLAAAGLDLEVDDDITAAVLAARRRRAERERLALTAVEGDAAPHLVAERGSPFFEAFAGGALCYRRLRARRSRVSPPARMPVVPDAIAAAARFSLLAMAEPGGSPG